MLALLLAATTYLVPPQNVIDAFDAKPLPDVILSPARDVLALTQRRAQPTIAELARPMLRLAGARINPNTFGPQRASLIYAITLKRISDGNEVVVTVPANATIGNVKFSPDGSQLSFVNTASNDTELWVASTSTGKATRAAQHLNATTGDACDWLHDNATLICKFVPLERGPAPAEPDVPAGPNVQETSGKAAQAATYEDMLKTEHDEDLFAYYFTSQLGLVNGSQTTRIGESAIYDEVTPSPSGQYFLVTKIKRPFSHLIPMNGFPIDVQVLDRKAAVVRTIADKPSREGVPLTGVETGPRAYRWRFDQPATLVWAEALDNGDLKNKVPFRDRLMTLAAPFTATPTEFAKTEWRFTNIQYTDKGIALLSEFDRPSRHVRTWILDGGEPRKLLDRKQDAAYENPGSPVLRGDATIRGGNAFFVRDSGPILQYGDSIYLIGEGASKEGDRPFLDRLNLKTLANERLFHSAADAYELPLAPLTDDASQILRRRETPKDPPNWFAGNRQITSFKDPQPMFRGVQHQYVTYKRNDGVTLSATLYLPPNAKQGERLPVIMWAYPREFGDADSASQVTGSPNRFLVVSGYSHLFLLLSGYAIFDNPTMPIIGPGETANDTYVDQLVADAQAAVDKVVDMGVGDRDRIGIGGHSYGAFMTANLLAHSRLFRAGFAESGAYNRTLTPFGF